MTHGMHVQRAKVRCEVKCEITHHVHACVGVGDHVTDMCAPNPNPNFKQVGDHVTDAV